MVSALSALLILVILIVTFRRLLLPLLGRAYRAGHTAQHLADGGQGGELNFSLTS